MAADFMQAGLSWLNDQLKANASQTITYTRGITQVTVKAVYGSKLLKLNDMYDNRLVKSDADFLISAAEIQDAFAAKNATFSAPRRGDRITAVFPEGTQNYEVAAPGNEPHFQLDEYHLRYRIHAMRVS